MRKYLYVIATILFSASAYAQQDTTVIDNETLQAIFAQGSDRGCWSYSEIEDGVCRINLCNASAGNSFVQAPTAKNRDKKSVDFIDLGLKRKEVKQGKNVKHRSTTVGNKYYPLLNVGHPFLSVELGVDYGQIKKNKMM